MKRLILSIILLTMTACTTYVVEKRMPDGSYTVVKVRSSRDLEQPNLHYLREGDKASFDFEAANVDNNTEAYLNALTGMMNMMMLLMPTAEPTP